MIPLYSTQQFSSARSIDKLPLQCEYCSSTFFKRKSLIQQTLDGYQYMPCRFCSRRCDNLAKITKQPVSCTQCGKQFSRIASWASKKTNQFCSKSCSATYNNTHKKYGTRRSKLESWIEQQLATLYPKLPIEFNQKTAIDSELDIYIPSLRLGFELNGIYHYEPIHGSEKLSQVQQNDTRKFHACAKNQISLCVIDTSSFKHFKEVKAKEFLSIVTKIIDQHIHLSKSE